MNLGEIMTYREKDKLHTVGVRFQKSAISRVGFFKESDDPGGLLYSISLDMAFSLLIIKFENFFL